jgi:hypothetical protein
MLDSFQVCPLLMSLYQPLPENGLKFEGIGTEEVLYYFVSFRVSCGTWVLNVEPKTYLFIYIVTNPLM